MNWNPRNWNYACLETWQGVVCSIALLIVLLPVLFTVAWLLSLLNQTDRVLVTFVVLTLYVAVSRGPTRRG